MQERAEAQVQDLSHRGPTNTPFTTSLAGSATSTASRAGSPPQIKTLRGLTQPPATPPPPSPHFPTDRKRGGTGNSVSVRIDLGGRRIIKKKKKNQKHKR